MNTSSSNSLKTVEIIKDKLFWISSKNPPKNQTNAFFFNIDEDLVYEPFFADFGPLNLGKTYRFVQELDKLLKDGNYSKSKFYHHTCLDVAKKANSAYLMGAFQVITMNKTAEEAWKPFAESGIIFPDFRDASYTTCNYKCTILDCLRGLEYGIKLKWFDMKTFNLRDYEFYEKVENGDLNWIIPGKFVAFSGPSGQARDPDGYRRFTPEDYVPIFKKLGVTTVIRLNNKQYDEQRFVKNGINHTDLYFVDGSCPSDDILERFLQIAEQEKGAIAIHCKAGLGRTGSLIAAYAMKHYRFLAPDFIGYIRLCRPGSILGPQQQFLVDKQSYFHKWTDYSSLYKSIKHSVEDFHIRRENLLYKDFDSLNLSKKSPGMSPLEKKIAKEGDDGQAERLNYAKQSRQGATPIFNSSTSSYSHLKSLGHGLSDEPKYNQYTSSSRYRNYPTYSTHTHTSQYTSHYSNSNQPYSYQYSGSGAGTWK